jgi:hypothetical protein
MAEQNEEGRLAFLIKEFEYVEDAPDEEAQAAISLNPFVTWVKFILTDDMPNANKQRIPVEEFANIIKSGVLMPLKMAYEKISDGHENSFPVGVISHLKQHKNQVMGLAALWDKERPQDVNLIRERYNSKMPLQLSWEVLFKNSTLNAESGVTDLQDTSLRAVTLVGRPAYEGRTPIIAVASTEDNKLDELEKLQKEVADLTAKLTEKESALAEKMSALESKEAELSSASTELEELRKFKNEFDSAKAEVEALAKIKEKFISAGIEKDEEYFSSNKQTLMSLAPEGLDFMLQEMVAFSAVHKESTSAKKEDASAPNLVASSSGTPSAKEIAEYLRKNPLKK